MPYSHPNTYPISYIQAILVLEAEEFPDSWYLAAYSIKTTSKLLFHLPDLFKIRYCSMPLLNSVFSESVFTCSIGTD
jgi:hypothetical protein